MLFRSVDSVLAYAIFIANIQAGATAADQIVGAFLWNIINDAQTANWGSANTAQAAGWTQINDTQTTNWIQIAA